MKIREKETWLHRSLTYLRTIISVREHPHKVLAPIFNPIKISVQKILSRTLGGINHFSPVFILSLNKLIELTIPNNNFVTLSENINDQNACKKYWRQLTLLSPVVAQRADSLTRLLMEPTAPSSRTSSTH